MLRTMRQIMAYALVTLSRQSWYGGTDTFDQVPRPNLKVGLSQAQKQACRRKPPTFRYRGRSR